MRVNVRQRTLPALRLPVLRLPRPKALIDARPPLPWRWLWMQAASLWVATRLAYAILTYYFPLMTGGEPPSPRAASLALLIRRWAQWDGAIYLRLAREGYWSSTYTVFFPLYPGLVRLCAALIGPHWALAGLLVSNASALVAFVAVAALAMQVAPPGAERKTARIALALFATYPLAFFTVAAYTDGLFVALAALAMLFGMRRRWGWAALLALLAGICRPVAPALMLPLAWEALQGNRAAHAEGGVRQALRATTPALAAVLAPAISIGGYCVYLWVVFGDPLKFIHAEHHWAHFSMSPLLSIPVAIDAFAHVAFASPLQARTLLDLAPVLVGLVIALVAARRAPLTFTLYLFALLYIITSEPINYTDLFVSGGRYMLAAFPVCIILAGWLRRSEWRSEWLLPALCWSGALLQAILAIFFLRHGWIV
ncbi:MAG TPA: hypothetical protein VE338_09710 [Ktedonobacterales bacterium]|nr:hypothetical protein [Ktedonobacterales bacterium]